MKAKVNGIELNYEVSGKEGAPWLVFSHSLACNVRMWDPTIAAFKDQYRILNYDMRGHGQSNAPGGAYTLDMLADDVLGLMKELKIEARAEKEGITMRTLIEQGLRQALTHRREKAAFRLRKATFKGRGLSATARGMSWEQLREQAYEGRGG